MDETQLRLDGNAAAGILREVFVHELSAARGECASCGAIAQSLGCSIARFAVRDPDGRRLEFKTPATVAPPKPTAPKPASEEK